MKRKNLVVPIIPTKVVESMAKIIAQHVKPTKVPLKFLVIFILVMNIVHLIVLKRQKFRKCFELPTTTTIIVTKLSKHDNIPVNIVTHN